MIQIIGKIQIDPAQATNEQIVMFLYDLKGLVSQIDVMSIYKIFIKRAYPLIEALIGQIQRWLNSDSQIPLFKLIVAIYENK